MAEITKYKGGYILQGITRRRVGIKETRQNHVNCVEGTSFPEQEPCSPCWKRMAAGTGQVETERQRREVHREWLTTEGGAKGSQGTLGT